MNKSMNQLNELIEITRDGQRFYLSLIHISEPTRRS